MITFSIVSILLFVLYLAVYFARYRFVPSSLSETFYIIRHHYLFTLTLFMMVICILPPMLEITDPNFQFLAFLCPAGIGFVGAAPCFHEDFQYKVHTGGALLGACTGLAWVILGAHLWWLIPAWICIILGLGLLTRTLKKGLIFWLEMVAFGSVLTSLLIGVI